MRTKRSNVDIILQKCEECGKEVSFLKKIASINKKVCVECALKYPEKMDTVQ